MKKIKNVSKGNTTRILENRSFRRTVKQMFTSWMKRQSSNGPVTIEQILSKLEELEARIDIMFREIARQSKERKAQPNE